MTGESAIAELLNAACSGDHAAQDAVYTCCNTISSNSGIASTTDSKFRAYSRALLACAHAPLPRRSLTANM